MTNRFLISVAALALFAGTGFANAQGTMGRDSGASGGQQMQHSQQPSGAAERGGAMKKNETAEEKAGAKGARSDERAQDRESKGMASENKSGAKDMKAEGKEGRDKDMKAEGSKSGTTTSNAQNREGTSTSTNNAQSRQGTGANTNMNAEGRTGTSTSTQTTGQAGAGAKLSTEQRTQITSVIHEEHVAPVTNVNFSISVGTRVPREGIEFHALPSRVVTIYPEWRAYKYILVRDEIVIIDPATYEIVAILT